MSFFFAGNPICFCFFAKGKPLHFGDPTYLRTPICDTRDRQFFELCYPEPMGGLGGVRSLFLLLAAGLPLSIFSARVFCASKVANLEEAFLFPQGSLVAMTKAL